VFFSRKRGTSAVKHTVAEDWIAALPRDKSRLFESVVRDWESHYAMLSIALDDAISQRASGKLVSARQHAAVSSELLSRLAAVLIQSCEATAKRGRHLHNLPAVNPLNAGFFRGDTGRSAGTRSALLHNLLFVDRQRFFQKVRILSETIERLAEEFTVAAGDISDGISTRPVDSWKNLEALHDDFTTCMRESEVLLKSFLRALPSEQLAAFQDQLEEAPASLRTRAKPRVRARRASA
jgi:DNA segregation ATPase FtsK/SpoIIIE-like protein